MARYIEPCSRSARQTPCTSRRVGGMRSIRAVLSATKVPASDVLIMVGAFFFFQTRSRSNETCGSAANRQGACVVHSLAPCAKEQVVNCKRICRPSLQTPYEPFTPSLCRSSYDLFVDNLPAEAAHQWLGIERGSAGEPKQSRQCETRGESCDSHRTLPLKSEPVS